MEKLQQYYPSKTIIKLRLYTYKNIASTAIEVSRARKMTRQDSHLGPVFLQGPQLASSSEEHQQKFNLYQGSRTCRGKGKRLPFNDVIIEWTLMIQLWHL